MYLFWYIVAERQYPLPRVVRFFQNENGREPVREWIKGHDEAEMKLIGKDILKAQWSAEWKRPLVEYLGHGLYEIRTNLINTIARTLFFADGNEMILVHGFTKKSRKTPKTDLDLALKRKAQYEEAQSASR